MTTKRIVPVGLIFSTIISTWITCLATTPLAMWLAAIALLIGSIALLGTVLIDNE